MPGVITWGLGEGDALGICMPGVITWGLGEGDALGICMPGVITWGLGEGDAVGIFIPGVITCGLADGEGLGLAVVRLELFLARLVVFFFVAARFAFDFAADGLGITCPSCCGNAVPLSANTSAKEQSVRSFLQLLNRFIIPPPSSQIVNI
jgi:hypothetical protein